MLMCRQKLSGIVVTFLYFAKFIIIEQQGLLIRLRFFKFLVLFLEHVDLFSNLLNVSVEAG